MFAMGDVVRIVEGKYIGQVGVIKAQASAPIAKLGFTYRIRLEERIGEPIKEVWCYENQLKKFETIRVEEVPLTHA